MNLKIEEIKERKIKYILTISSEFIYFIRLIIEPRNIVNLFVEVYVL